jgi:electron transfer flavoprotein beta subunit
VKIIVLIKSVLDTRIALECSEETGRLMEGWNVPVLNPDDSAAVSRALEIKKSKAGIHVTVVHLGPPSGERFIREALALGCDEGLRVWDEGLEELHTEGKQLILSRVAEILGFDLLFTGTKSLDTGGAQLGILLSCTLKIPCLTRVTGIAIRERGVTATRKLEQGFREEIASPTPLVVAMEADDDPLAYASFPAVALAAERTIPCFDLSGIGISREAVRESESRLIFGPLRLPAPMLQYIQPPDSSLPAFERRRQIGEGSVQKRQGRIVKGGEDEVVEELFQTLVRDGWLDHLRNITEKA